MNIRAIIFLVIFIVAAILYSIIPIQESVPIGAIYLFFPLFAAFIGLYTSRIYSFKNANGRALILIAAGLVFWAIAEIITYVYTGFISDIETPEIAAYILLLGYPIVGVGIYQGFIASGIKLKEIKKSRLIIVLSASIILTILVAYFGVYQAYDPEADLLKNIVSMCYGLGDLILIIASMLTILVAEVYTNGKLASFWKTIALGFFMFLIADIMFAIVGGQYTEDLYEVIMELTWMAAYLVLTYAMLENYMHILSVQKKIKLKLQQRKKINSDTI